MFGTTLTLTPSTGVATTSAVARVYDLTSIEAGKAIRTNAAAGLSTPQVLTISHAPAGSGDKVRDRHLVRLDQTFAASGDIPAQTASVYLVIDAPRNTVTAANLHDMVGTVLHQCNTVANLAKLYNNEP